MLAPRRIQKFPTKNRGGWFLRKFNTGLPHGPATPLPDTHLKALKTGIHLLAHQFPQQCFPQTAKIKKKTKFPPADKQIVVHPPNGTVFSHKEESNTDTLQCGWTLKIFCHVRAFRHIVCFHIEGSRIHKSWETEGRVVSTGAERGRWEKLNRYGIPLGDPGNVLELDKSTGCTMRWMH